MQARKPANHKICKQRGDCRKGERKQQAPDNFGATQVPE
jgi:hypothetical protein